jgi:hypothetical protein
MINEPTTAQLPPGPAIAALSDQMPRRAAESTAIYRLYKIVMPTTSTIGAAIEFLRRLLQLCHAADRGGAFRG